MNFKHQNNQKVISRKGSWRKKEEELEKEEEDEKEVNLQLK